MAVKINKPENLESVYNLGFYLEPHTDKVYLAVPGGDGPKFYLLRNGDQRINLIKRGSPGGALVPLRIEDISFGVSSQYRNSRRRPVNRKADSSIDWDEVTADALHAAITKIPSINYDWTGPDLLNNLAEREKRYEGFFRSQYKRDRFRGMLQSCAQDPEWGITYDKERLRQPGTTSGRGRPAHVINLDPRVVSQKVAEIRVRQMNEGAETRMRQMNEEE